jgi:hypothetical protein
MKAQLCLALLVLGSLAVAADAPPNSSPKATRKIPAAELEDKVRGGWAGQMIGVTYGAPTEFRFLQKINDQLRDWKPEELEGALDQDDLYVEMTFSEVMDRLGVNATSDDYGEAFKGSKYQLWHANLGARRALLRGVKGSMSGNPRYNLHANDIDFQIESDFIGLMTPGMPRAAQRYAERVGRVMNYGDGLYGGIFTAAMYSAAYVESDPRKVVEAGVAAIPAGSIYAQVIGDVLRWSKENPSDWKETWQLLEDKWDRNDACPEGALRPFNIDASLNGAYVAMGLLYGGKDFEKTMDIAMRGGQDSDCNPASAAGILGTMIGFKAIPAKWTDPLAAMADKKFSYTNYSYNTSVEKTIARMKQVVKLEGGKVEAGSLIIPLETPVTLKLEQFNPGKVVERIAVTDPRWKFTGAWDKAEEEGSTSQGSNKSGSEAVVTFNSTGAILAGTLRPEGGLFDVYLDGKSMGTLDSYNVDGERYREGLWGKFDLAPGEHTLRVVVKGRPFQSSTGAWVNIEDLVTYQK